MSIQLVVVEILQAIRRIGPDCAGAEQPSGQVRRQRPSAYRREVGRGLGRYQERAPTPTIVGAACNAAM
jgi:hypothetical protein